MKVSDEALLQGPLSPYNRYDPYARSVLNAAEYGEDMLRERIVHDLMVLLPRPLSFREKQAAAKDQGRAPRVYAPASARISKEPLPCDAEIIAEGRRHEITAESARHPGDRSDPAELR